MDSDAQYRMRRAACQLCDGAPLFDDPRELLAHLESKHPDQMWQIWPADEEVHVEEMKPGPVETALRRDLARFGAMDMGARGTLATLALRMAEAIDGWEEDRSSSGLSALARAHQELRATLEKLTETVVTDDDDDEFIARMSSVVRDAAKSGAADVRDGDGGGSGSPG